MDTTTKITNGSAIALAIFAIVLSSGLVGQDKIYVCLDTSIAMHCDSLSKVNAEGMQTRCYYFSEELNKTRYKQCSSGWLSYEPQPDDSINLNETERIYLVCENKNELISECNIINSNETVFKAGN